MEEGSLFEVVFLEDASEFLRTLQPQARKKIYYNIRKVAGGVRDSDLFKKLDGSSDLWDVTNKRMVVATHGFVKKTWKVPSKDIAKAESIRDKYYKEKQGGKK